MRIAKVVLMLFAVVFAAAAYAAPARDAGQGKPLDHALTPLQRGKASYEDRCAVCHGNRGRGDGPAADALRTKPTNLAMLRKTTGSFPAARVQAAIKGTDPVVAHGATGMMVWGAFFLADANGSQAGADARIDEVVRYIETLQAK